MLCCCDDRSQDAAAVSANSLATGGRRIPLSSGGAGSASVAPGRDRASRATLFPIRHWRSQRRPKEKTLGRTSALVQWVLPVTTLVLMPKCPACVVAYVLLFTGVGLSFDVAAVVRWTLIAVSVAALAYLALRFAVRALAYRGSALSLAAPSATASLSAGDQEFRNRSAADSSKPSTGPATIR